MTLHGLNRTTPSSYDAILDATQRRVAGAKPASAGFAGALAVAQERERYKIEGPVVSLAEALERNGGQGVIRATPEQIAEMALYDQQMQAREAAGARYAARHPDQVHGQVVVGGKLFATVYQSGSAVTPYAMNMTADGAGTALANTRLAEIARAAGGQVIYDHFFPTPANPGAVVPESVLPPVTARSHQEILMDLLRDRQSGG
jgi:hypothetical protein